MTTGIRRWLFVMVGLIFVGLGTIGAIVPGIPTTPFLLVASYCFARSSPRLHHWLRHSPIFGHLIRDWEVHRGIRRSVKISAMLMVIVVCGATVLFSSLSLRVRIIIGVFGLIGLTVVASLPIVGKSNRTTSVGSASPDEKPPSTAPETAPPSPTSSS